MKNIDFNYLCLTIGNLSGVPIRIYENEKLVYYHSVVNLPKDPVLIYLNEIMKINDHVGYFVTKHFYYYGIINTENLKIILGPSRQVPSDDQELKEIAFLLDVPSNDIYEFVNAMKSIISMPLEAILQILCTLNYIANNEKLTLGDIYLHDLDKDSKSLLYSQEKETHVDETEEELHNTLSLEETILHIVRKGDISALEEFARRASVVQGGKLASGQMRQVKNTFIVTATLVSRAAIRGGLNPNKALSMSDRYIQQCEVIDNIGEIANLQFKMISDYTERVNRIRLGKEPSKLVIDVANYIQGHLSEHISTEEMAKSLYLSRCRLSTKFKELTNMTLTDFILKEKTEEAKRLLIYSDKTIISISTYLGFSSQSHFTHVFKKYTSLSPIEYREKHNH